MTYWLYDAWDFPLTLTEDAGQLVGLHFGAFVPENASNEKTPPIEKAEAWLRAYFAGKEPAVEIPLAPRGTDFERSVWRALLTIPKGETRSYSDIAQAIGNPKAVRAVGRAIGKNPIGIMIPCHRVIGKDRSLTGFAGGLPAKRALLANEGQRISGQRVASEKL